MTADSIPNFLKNRANLTPNREAIVYKDERLTFQELYKKAYFMAGVLTANGVKEKDYIGFLVKNDLQTVITLLSLHIIGAKAVLLNNRLTSDELIFQLKDAQATFLLTEKTFVQTIQQIKEELPLCIIHKEDISSYTFEQPVEKKEVSLQETCTIMYTSGTTGFPKGVIQSYGNHWWSAVGSALNLGLHEKDVWLCALPLFHISGYSILMRSLVYGIKIVLHDHFSIEKVIDDIDKEKVTMMSVVTTMLKKLESAVDGMFPSYFRCMLLGGGPASIDIIKNCLHKGIPVYYSYGMTETSSQIVTLPPEDSVRKVGSAGKPLFPSQIKIVNETGEEVSENTAGEIIVHGPNVSKGYLNKGPNTVNGWFHTGDIGYKDSEGFLYVLDRRSDLIISGGENIYPAEIEGMLTSIDGVLDAGVIGEDDEKWGQVPIAFVVKDNNRLAITEEMIHSFCAKKLAKYKIPKKILFIEKIPRNAAKKILRRELRTHLGQNK
ncbi:o-succinylbenzoate--CoA ligase [Niallia sp. 01092]|uniref:o-succinylbenzoate--CoA ligase n=1 Tax=unclassified Niallia TaxID=2837522 RepID=UPI003FD566EB